MKRVAIIGATSRIAECCARLWAAEGTKFFLAARDQERLVRIRADLGVRIGNPDYVTAITFDALAYESFSEIAQAAEKHLGTIDIVLIAHGVLPEQNLCEQDLDVARRSLELNGVSAVLLAEAFAARMAPRRQGVIAVIGSVAGDRGRRSNYVYGAAKGMVDRYLQGMRHRLGSDGLQIVTIKPGPTDTPMTANYSQPGVRLADPETVARRIVDGVEARRTVIYAPGRWRWIMLIIRHIPDWIFHHMRL